MKKTLFLIGAFVMLGASAFTLNAIKLNVAEQEVKDLVKTAYLHGAFNELNPDAMAAGFHKDFAIFSAKGEELSRYEIADWVAGVRKRKESSDFDPASNIWDYKFG